MKTLPLQYLKIDDLFKAKESFYKRLAKYHLKKDENARSFARDGEQYL